MKLPFYAIHRVDEILIIDSDQRTVQWLALGGVSCEQVEHGALTGLSAAELPTRIEWPG